MRCAAALSTSSDSESALEAVVDRLAEAFGGEAADLALVFASIHHAGALGRVGAALAGRGLGRTLLERIEALAPGAATSYALFTGAGSLRNQRIYRKAGYRLQPGEPFPGAVRMTKRIGPR